MHLWRQALISETELVKLQEKIMHTNQGTTPARRTPSGKTGSDAIKFLIDDHNKVKKLNLDLEELGLEMAGRKETLMEKQG